MRRTLFLIAAMALFIPLMRKIARADCSADARWIGSAGERINGVGEIDAVAVAGVQRIRAERLNCFQRSDSRDRPCFASGDYGPTRSLGALHRLPNPIYKTLRLGIWCAGRLDQSNKRKPAVSKLPVLLSIRETGKASEMTPVSGADIALELLRQLLCDRCTQRSRQHFVML